MEPLYTKEEKSKVYALSQAGLTITYAFCENCILGGKSVPLADSAEVKATRIAGINYLPTGFFEFALGCKAMQGIDKRNHLNLAKVQAYFNA